MSDESIQVIVLAKEGREKSKRVSETVLSWLRDNIESLNMALSEHDDMTGGRIEIVVDAQSDNQYNVPSPEDLGSSS